MKFDTVVYYANNSNSFFQYFNFFSKYSGFPILLHQKIFAMYLFSYHGFKVTYNVSVLHENFEVHFLCFQYFLMSKYDCFLIFIFQKFFVGWTSSFLPALFFFTMFLFQQVLEACQKKIIYVSSYRADGMLLVYCDNVCAIIIMVREICIHSVLYRHRFFYRFNIASTAHKT